jgi:hypothetical protein
VSSIYQRKIIIVVNFLTAVWIIAVVCLYYSKPSLPKVHHIPAMHRLYWFEETLVKTNPDFKNLILKRRYTDIDFNGNNADDKTRLAFADVLVREIVTNNDTLRGLRFNFKDSATFGTFFSVLTILKENSARHYVPVDYYIWFFDTPYLTD